MIDRVVHGIDREFLRLFGIRYAAVTRDTLIHDRCRYLVHLVSRSAPGPIRILDVGCGSALALLHLDKCCPERVAGYVGIDKTVERLEPRYSRVRMPHIFHEIDLDSDWNLGSFDLVWCSEVIEHLLDDQRLMNRMAAHLVGGGTLAITTPSQPFVEIMAKSFPELGAVSQVQDGGHVRMGYELRDFYSMAPKAGLEVLSHAWISPMTVADVAWRRSSLPFRTVRLVREGLWPRPHPFVEDQPPQECADHFWSLAVVMSTRKPDDEPR
jgi:SAM-dependent methyltransferase